MVIITCPKYLTLQKKMIAKLVYASELSQDDRALADGLLDWIKEICDAEICESDSVEIKFQSESD